MINKLINLANYLDKSGFKKEADLVDSLVKSSAVPIIAPTILQTLKNQCIDWNKTIFISGVEDPWVLAETILKTMKKDFGRKNGYYAYKSLENKMKEAGLNEVATVLAEINNVYAGPNMGEMLNNMERIEKVEDVIASASYRNYSAFGSNSDIKLNKKFFIDKKSGGYCLTDIGELAGVIGHELAHLLLGHVEAAASGISGVFNSLQKIRTEDGKLEFIDPDGNPYTVDKIDLSMNFQSQEHHADKLGCYFAETSLTELGIQYRSCDISGVLSRNWGKTEEESLQKREACPGGCSWGEDCYDDGHVGSVNGVELYCVKGKWMRRESRDGMMVEYSHYESHLLNEYREGGQHVEPVEPDPAEEEAEESGGWEPTDAPMVPRPELPKRTWND